MALQQSRRKCRECGKKTLHAKETFSGGMGCLLTILTAGLFIPVWGFVMLGDALKPWRCQVCGKGRNL